MEKVGHPFAGCIRWAPVPVHLFVCPQLGPQGRVASGTYSANWGSLMNFATKSDWGPQLCPQTRLQVRTLFSNCVRRHGSGLPGCPQNFARRPAGCPQVRLQARFVSASYSSTRGFLTNVAAHSTAVAEMCPQIRVRSRTIFSDFVRRHRFDHLGCPHACVRRPAGLSASSHASKDCVRKLFLHQGLSDQYRHVF